MSKSFGLLIIAFLFAGAVIAGVKKKQPAGVESLKTVTIGEHTWTAENLSVDKFRNGDEIPEAASKEEWVAAGRDKKPAWCYYNNDPSNAAKYGRLYNWFAVNDPRGLIPEGWHIPDEATWNSMVYSLGKEAGKKLRSTSGWKEDANGSNASGFNALPGGTRNDHASFFKEGESAFYWTSDAFVTGTAGYGFEVQGDYDHLGKNIYGKDGLSVRCVKD